MRRGIARARLTAAAALLFSGLAAAPGLGAAAEPCIAKLDSLSRSAAAPGGDFILYGRWGAERGAQTPVINRGGRRELEVLSWTGTAVRVRVPKGLQPGTYRVGVYCGGGDPHSSSFLDLEVLPLGRTAPAEQAEPAQPRAPEEKPAAAGAWSERFTAEWLEKGRKAAADRPWLRRGLLSVIGDRGVPLPVLREAAASAGGQLGELGALRIAVKVIEPPAPAALASCSSGGVLETKCFSEGLAAARAAGAGYAAGAVLFVTDSAIGKLPERGPGGVTFSPPAGEASDEAGWIVISEYFRRKPPGGRDDSPFARHGRDHTVRHELGHLLGLPHHEAIGNPGYPEARSCTACPHKGAGGHQPPHAECLMFCGSSDDDWFHLLSFGKGFGLCAKCAAAARALVDGIEGRQGPERTNR
ncbi:MAG TPA: hypothetical protein PKI19_10435 [Elusimicrobiales bacterium]|nr:hypothetical protein [Elusimicrobiales bacterium]